MPMAHVEVPPAKCSLSDTEVVVFVPREGETTSSTCQRFVTQKEDDLEAREAVTHIVVAQARPEKLQPVDAMRPKWDWFSYEDQGIQDAASVMIEDEHMVLTHDWAQCHVCHEDAGFGDARLHAPRVGTQDRIGGDPNALDFDDANVVGQGGKHRPCPRTNPGRARTGNAVSAVQPSRPVAPFAPGPPAAPRGAQPAPKGHMQLSRAERMVFNIGQ